MFGINFLNKKITVHFEFSVAQLLKVGCWAVVFAYILWEAYWYWRIGLYFIKWHTHIASSILIFGLPLWILSKIFNRFLNQTTAKNLQLLVSSVFFLFVVLEVGFIFSDIKKLYSEKRFGYYLSPYEYNNKNIYHTFYQSDTATNKAPEYSYLFHYNTLGYSGKEWVKEKDSTKLRIICLGDSFTEGDGAPSDSSYPVVLQAILGQQNFEVLNAGVRGSDPVFGYYNLEKRLLSYQPDIVLQAISENDVLYDMTIRGGFERFVGDSLVQFTSPPAWEPLYAMNYTLRTFFEALGMDMKNPAGNFRSKKFQAERNQTLQNLYSRFDSLASANNFEVVFIFYPTKWEVDRKEYDYNFQPSKAFIKALHNSEAIDIFDCYFNTFEKEQKNYKDYYWIIDGHHNSRGYAMMANCIAESLKNKKP